MIQTDKISQDLTTQYETEKCRQQINEFQQQMTVIQIATLIVDDVANILCKEILDGALIVQKEQSQLPLEKRFEPIKKKALIQSKMQQIDIEEHRRKVKELMRINKKFRQRLNNRTLQAQNSLKKYEMDQKTKQKQQKQKQLQNRRKLIAQRMTNKSQIMKSIKKMALQTDQKIKQVKSKSFLYQQKQKQFKSQFILPKIQQQKKILQRRRNKMKSIDIKQLLDHQKSYQIRLKQNTINRSMTSRIIKSQTQYNPPAYTPKSYLIFQAQQHLKKQAQMLKQKQTQINKLKQKQFVKNISQLHKLQHQIQKSRSISPQQIESNPQQKKIKPQLKVLSKQQVSNLGNHYFKELLKQIKQVKQRKQKKNKQKQQKQKKEKQLQKSKLFKTSQELLQLQIREEQIKTIHKIQKTERIHRIRSKKIQKIFQDQKLHPLVKFERLQHEVQKLDMVLKTKNSQSEDLHQRNEAAGSYLNAIKAKLKLLQASNPK